MKLKLGSYEGGSFELPLEALLTHFVALGATGSGKTGLLTVLVEELAAAGVTSIAMDVKGDLANLALKDEEWARRAASEGATLGQLPEAAVYTPGYCSGRPLKLLPPSAGDPISSAWAAEAILSLTKLSGDRGAQALLTALFQRKRITSMSSLAKHVLEPPPVLLAGIPQEILLPEGSRRRLARELAALAVDPIFGCFTEGEKLELEPPPPVKVVYLAHLPEKIRILTASLILSEIYRWMMSRGGCSTPRLAVVFDEVRGYLPPYPMNPPTKEPLSTLVRQGRGFGVSVLLATQNPRDLDYRALSNVGTWAVGVLRAKQDREAVAEAMSDVFGVSRSDVSSRIAALKPREFLVFSTVLEQPIVVRVRHTLTPLRGPLTLEELSKRFGWREPKVESQGLPQYTLVVERSTGVYKPYIIAQGKAEYRYPARRRSLNEFTAIIDPSSSSVILLDSPIEAEPGSPPGPPIDPKSLESLYAQSKRMLQNALTIKVYETRRGMRPKPGESVDEFQARIAFELEERRRRINERYRSRLRNLISKAEKIAKRREEVSSLLTIVKPLISKRVTKTSLLQILERWNKARERAAELDERERSLLDEIERLRAKWFEDLRRLDEQYAVLVREVKPEIVELEIGVLWVPEHYDVRQMGRESKGGLDKHAVRC